MCAKRAGLIIDAKTPIMHPTNTTWFDKLISLTIEDKTGLPFGSWIIFAGAPGSGKTTLALTLLNGLSKSEDVETWHYDWEMGDVLAHQAYVKHDWPHINYYRGEPDPNTLLTIIGDRAKELEKLGKSMAVVVDSFKAFGESHHEMKATAMRIKNMRQAHPNLLIISINHQTKGKKTEGPAGIRQWCDVELLIKKDGMFRYASTPEKNRFQAQDGIESVKLILDKNNQVIESGEPDFVSNIPILKWFRSLPKKKAQSKV